MALLKDYKSTLKDPAVESITALVFFRPLAFLFVKLIYRFPVGPDMVSVSSMVPGIGSGVLFALGTRASFLYAGILVFITHLMDCSDGVLARMKKNGTLRGRILDGTIDYINAAAVYIGLLIGLSKLHFPSSTFFPWFLVILAFISNILHAMIYDYYQCEFLAHALGKKYSNHEDVNIYSNELKRLKAKNTKKLEQFLYHLYLGYLRFQVKNKTEEKHYDAGSYFRTNRKLMRLWSFICPSTYAFVLATSSILGIPLVFFGYSIIFGNTWMLFLLIFQIRANNRVVQSDH